MTLPDTSFDTPSSSPADALHGALPPRHGVLLFAHGARDPAWARPFEAVALHLTRLRPQALVGLAYLEFMSPSLPEAGARMAAAGCSRVDVLPVFLGAGGHVRRDLPRLLDVLREAHPGTQWQLHPAAGEAPPVIEALAAWAASAATP